MPSRVKPGNRRARRPISVFDDPRIGRTRRKNHEYPRGRASPPIRAGRAVACAVFRIKAPARIRCSGGAAQLDTFTRTATRRDRSARARPTRPSRHTPARRGRCDASGSKPAHRPHNRPATGPANLNLNDTEIQNLSVWKIGMSYLTYSSVIQHW